MAYLSHFKYDIFISYARLNDKVPPGDAEGWVTRFHKELRYALSQRFERDDDIEIWRDREKMDESVLFGKEIPERINESGIFLALTSRAFLTQRGYCHKELTWFHDKARKETYGLAVDNRPRIINVLLHNVPHTEWLPELPEASGFHFNDRENTDEDGEFSDPDSELFEVQMRKLVDALTTTLRRLKTLTDAAPRLPPSPPRRYDFTLFLAHAEGDLDTLTRRRVSEDLRLKNIEVITDIPPPSDGGTGDLFGEPAHEQAVKQAMSRAGMCVHLLDGEPGREVANGGGETFYRKQVELGMQSGKQQLIYVPEKLKVEAIEDETHKEFIKRLEGNARGRASYKFIRKTQPGQIAVEILQEIARLKGAGSQSAAPSTALLDIHEKDYVGEYDIKLQSVLRRRNLRLVINPASDGLEDVAIFDGVRKLMKVLIIVLGHVSDMWASSRLSLALKSTPPSLKFCGIYVPQPDRPLEMSAFLMPRNKIPVTFFFTPEQLTALLDKYLD